MRRERARKPRCTTPCMPPDSRANPGRACRRCWRLSAIWSWWSSGGWTADLRASDPAMRFAAAALPPAPVRTRARESAPVLVHGTLYARHVIDSGDGPGVIDWQQFGQGPIEFDAGTFLATIWRIGQKDAGLSPEAARTEEAFLAGTAGQLNPSAVAWYRAAMLLRLADKYGRQGGGALGGA